MASARMRRAQEKPPWLSFPKAGSIVGRLFKSGEPKTQYSKLPNVQDGNTYVPMTELNKEEPSGTGEDDSLARCSNTAGREGFTIQEEQAVLRKLDIV